MATHPEDLQDDQNFDYYHRFEKVSLLSNIAQFSCMVVSMNDHNVKTEKKIENPWHENCMDHYWKNDYVYGF